MPVKPTPCGKHSPVATDTARMIVRKSDLHLLTSMLMMVKEWELTES